MPGRYFEDRWAEEFGYLPMAAAGHFEESLSVTVTSTLSGSDILSLVDVLSVVATATLTGSDVLLRRRVPVSVVSNDGWDTGPTPSGDLADALAADDSDYITVTA